MDFKQFFRQSVLFENKQVTEWHKYIESNPELKAGVEILQQLEKLGGKAYIVGGTVRDIVLGLEPKDIDIATNVPLDIIDKNFKAHDIGKSKDFGIVTISHNGFQFEIAQFRQDGSYSDGRRPDSVEIVMDFKDDASRRDITINSMGVDKDGNIIDFFDGMGDIKNKVIRTVGDAHLRFGEDFLRMLRVPRFASRLGFKIDPQTLGAIQRSSANIKKVAAERILQELMKMAKQSGSKFADAIVILKDSGLLQHILPEVLELDAFEHSVEDHPEGNVFQHTIAALKASDVVDPIVNLGILLHDAGKAKTHTVNPVTGKHQYLGHALESANLIDTIADRLKMDNKSRESIKFAAINHMKMHSILNMKPSKIAALMDDPNWEVLKAVAYADSKARGHLFSQKDWDDTMAGLGELLGKFQGKNIGNAVKAVVNGALIKKIRPELKPGPIYGEIIAATIEWVLNNNIDINNINSIESFIKDYK